VAGCLALGDSLRARHAPSSRLQGMRPSDRRGQGPRHPGAASGQDVHVLHVQLRQAGPRPVLQWAGDLLHRVRGRPRASPACIARVIPIAVMLSHGRGRRPRRHAASGCRGSQKVEQEHPTAGARSSGTGQRKECCLPRRGTVVHLVRSALSHRMLSVGRPRDRECSSWKMIQALRETRVLAPGP
jgi:hypothetical protein